MSTFRVQGERLYRAARNVQVRGRSERAARHAVALLNLSGVTQLSDRERSELEACVAIVREARQEIPDMTPSLNEELLLNMLETGK